MFTDFARISSPQYVILSNRNEKAVSGGMAWSTSAIEFDLLQSTSSCRRLDAVSPCRDGRELAVPIEWFPRLRNTTADQRKQLKDDRRRGMESTGPTLTRTLSPHSAAPRLTAPNLPRPQVILPPREIRTLAARPRAQLRSRPRTHRSGRSRPRNPRFLAARRRHTHRPPRRHLRPAQGPHRPPYHLRRLRLAHGHAHRESDLRARRVRQSHRHHGQA